MLKLFSPVTLAAAMAIAAPALAAPEALPSVRVHTADLDLTSAAGRQTFHDRVKAASVRVCGRAPISPLTEAREVRACEAAAARSAQHGMTTALARATGATLVRGTR